ncbi:alpha/beta hydrolase [Lutibacter sp. TH_r2]|uniref:alpha/beta fold hydrolase n=1 Tax=Lutibacter sp. TH_r2 TaxID=3082083 RepID=UPI002952DEC5|nr:alpha/beta hydrolase [Lutibacter sp. TH_r2]MDV7188196.1 alpha/beta hydrolase [Lutibacter sp. TH_r2]
MKPKKHIYFVPGLGASSKIFENLKFPEDKFDLHYLEWLLPLSEKEKLEDYAKRMADLISEKNPILIGVSFGGIMVQEMAKHILVKKIILISSVKSRNELPNRLKLIQKTGVYKLFPASSINNIEDFSKYAFGNFAKKRIELYKKYLSVRDEHYLHWAIYNVLHWKQIEAPKNLIHIHGLEDHVFPIKHIKNCIQIEKGTHIMILTKAKIISKIIADLV